MSWGFVGAAAGAAGTAYAADKQSDAIESASEGLKVSPQIAEGVRRNLYTEGDKIRDRFLGTGEDVRARLTGVGEELLGRGESVREVRDTAAGQLQKLLSGEFDTTPGYEFTRDEALRASARGASARGANVSGNVLAELQNRAAGLASTEYNTILQNLSGLLGTSGSLTATSEGQYSQLIQNANNIYSNLFSTGERTRADMVTRGELQYVGQSADAIANQAELSLLQGQTQGAAGANIASLFGSAIQGLGDKKDG